MKRKIVMALGLGVSALALSACGTTMPVEVRMTRDAQAAPPPQTSFAGTYLAANFAASAGDVRNAANFYANALKEDPNNIDLLGRAFLFAAESGDEIGRAHV